MSNFLTEEGKKKRAKVKKELEKYYDVSITNEGCLHIDVNLESLGGYVEWDTSTDTITSYIYRVDSFADASTFEDILAFIAEFKNKY